MIHWPFSPHGSVMVCCSGHWCVIRSISQGRVCGGKCHSLPDAVNCSQYVNLILHHTAQDALHPRSIVVFMFMRQGDWNQRKVVLMGVDRQRVFMLSILHYSRIAQSTNWTMFQCLSPELVQLAPKMFLLGDRSPWLCHGGLLIASHSSFSRFSLHQRSNNGRQACFQ